MKLQVFSEIGHLREVMTHPPGLEVDRMPPAMMEELLFDDILSGGDARAEHRVFTRAIEAFGARNHDFQSLLTQALGVDGSATRDLVAEIARRENLGDALVGRLHDMEPAGLAEALVAGVIAPAERMTLEHFFDLRPLPNLLMSRDAQATLGHGVIIASMRRQAREREPLLSRFVFTHHPEFATTPRHFDFDSEASGIDAPRFGNLSLEGGDVLMLDEGVVAVGISERTMEPAIDLLAERLRGLENFHRLIMVRMPGSRSQMHLDTIFTRISANECLVYPPMFEKGYAETLSVVSIDLNARTPDLGRRHASFFDACIDAGLELEPIACGGPDNYIQQTREQWTDGANSFALAPGLILLYARNTATLEALDRRGYQAVAAADFADDPDPVLRRLESGGKSVLTLPSSELSRARGGPRCMTMPMVRDRLGQAAAVRPRE